MKVLDLFAGCGGLSLGFLNAGYEILAAFDCWDAAIRVYRQNFEHPIFSCDLSLHRDDVSIFQRYHPDMIIGGPPCQDFSSAGKRNEELGRSELTVTFAHIVAKVHPKWFVMENVDRVTRSHAFASARKILSEAGYGLTQEIIDASFCGVPQQRKRLFLIGQLGGTDEALKPWLHAMLSKKPMTVREYLGDVLDIEHYYRHPRSYHRRAVFSIDEPSPTIRGVNRPIPQTYLPHPGDTAPVGTPIRPLTTKERSFIQTFPETYIFTGTKTEIEQMIGNAVPVKQAEYVARCIRQYIQSQTGNTLGTPNSRQQLPMFQVNQISL